MSRHTSLYRMFDVEGSLLYVGITWRTVRRFQEHQTEKTWWSDVASITVEHFLSRVDADRAEREAIDTEEPRYNIVHNEKVLKRQQREAEAHQARQAFLRRCRPIIFQQWDHGVAAQVLDASVAPAHYCVECDERIIFGSPLSLCLDCRELEYGDVS